MSAKKFSSRTIWLIFADVAMIAGGIVLALYIRLGYAGAMYQLEENDAWYKIALATSMCLLLLYIYDLYDYTVIGNRTELFLRLVQALGIAWALLAILFYFLASPKFYFFSFNVYRRSPCITPTKCSILKINRIG